jgi:hypothetical protein
MNRPLDTVIELQAAFDRVREARGRLEGIPDWMRELHDAHSIKKQEIEVLKAEIEQAAGERRTAATEAQEYHQKLRTYQSQISQVRNQREYGALLQEIDAGKQRIKEHDDQGMAALERQDTARQKVEELESAFQELDERYAVELEKWEAEKPAVAEQVAELDALIATLRERLPQNVVVLFDRIQERYGGRALSEVLGVERVGKQPQIWSCSTCHYRVRPQAVVEIVNVGKIVTCDSCKRILYMPGAGG